jgi:glycosyltransferase involved in cell wall biosynthesis
MLVSIIIPVFNRENMVQCALESIALNRMTSTNKNILGQEIYWTNKFLIWKLKNLENKTVKKSHAILVCSEADANSMNELHSTQKFYALPNSCDFQNKAIKPLTEKPNNVDIVFVGSMYYPPNEHGALWFCHEVLPIINSNTALQINVWIIGYKPSEKVKQLAGLDNVNVTGSVDSVTEYYHKGSFAIAPIHFGGGTRIKILEAASYDLATVTTTIGVEGIAFNHMEEVLIADTPELFAQSCIQLAEDYKLRKSLSDASFLTGKRLYDHLAVAKQLEAILL